MKVLIVHPGTQHSTKLAAAIKESGHEVCLMTTVYKKTRSITNFLFPIFPAGEKKRIQSRVNHALNDEDIRLSHEIGGLLLLVVARIDKKKRIYTRLKRCIAKAVGKHAANVAQRENYDIVISFDSYSQYVFKKLEEQNFKGIKVTDYSAAFAPYVKRTYLSVIKQYPELKASLEAERPVLWNEKYYRDLCEEPKWCDYILCASNYTKRTLVSFGVNPDMIKIIPYGYNPQTDNDVIHQNDETFNILFVGNVSLMKGIPFLIQAVKNISNRNIRLTLVGGIHDTIRKMAEQDERIIVKGHVPHSMIAQEYCQANLFVFPSLSDGFGFAPLEAMSYGVPCAITTSSGIADIVENEYDGFVISEESADSIEKVINFCIDNKEACKMMGMRANEKASQYTIERYHKSIQEYVDSLKK